MRYLFEILLFCLVACSFTTPSATSASDISETLSCDNDRLTDFNKLLILAPHPDDEVLGFAGLADAFINQGKEVETWIVTDGDGYCDACVLWNGGSMKGATCDALTLSNLATPEVDSFAETRRLESSNAALALGRPAPGFLGYPDTGIAAAWSNLQAGNAQNALRRSDFSMCTDCNSCGEGYGGGPETDLSAASLKQVLSRLLAETDKRTLIATTHPLDSHGDHGGLGKLVMELAREMEDLRTIAYSVIHAHTSNGAAFPDCWYPQPAAAECPCYFEDRADADPEWLLAQREQRLKPDWPQHLPGDADYGEPLYLCLREELYGGAEPLKLAAINEYSSQMGTAGRHEGLLPDARSGLTDCNGYLLSFVRRNEVFVLRTTR